MRRLVLLATLISGCATEVVPAPHPCWYGPRSKGEALVDLLLIGLQAGVAVSEAAYPELPPTPAPPRKLTPPLRGSVRSASTGQPVPFAEVTLRGTNELVVLQATADARGRFDFPLPLPPDWYTLSADGGRPTRLWLHTRPPPPLEVMVSDLSDSPDDSAE